MPIDHLERYRPEARDLGEMHMSMFFAWALLRGLAAEEYVEELLPVVERRDGRPSDLASTLDGTLIDEQLTERGRAFAHHYYRPEKYFEDFDDAVMTGAGPARPPDSWKSFDRLAAVLDDRLAAVEG